MTDHEPYSPSQPRLVVIFRGGGFESARVASTLAVARAFEAGIEAVRPLLADPASEVAVYVLPDDGDEMAAEQPEAELEKAKLASPVPCTEQDMTLTQQIAADEARAKSARLRHSNSR